MFLGWMTTLAVAGAITVAPTSIGGVSVTIDNACSFTLQLYDNKTETPLIPGGETSRTLDVGSTGTLRHGRGDAATLAEFSVDASTKRPWYDISIIPLGPRNCSSRDDCRTKIGTIAYNVPMQIRPMNNTGRDTCEVVTCTSEDCPDGFAFPTDITKLHNCPPGTDFRLTFCPNGGGTPTSSMPPTPAPTESPTTVSPPASSPISPTKTPIQAASEGDMPVAPSPPPGKTLVSSSGSTGSTSSAAVISSPSQHSAVPRQRSSASGSDSAGGGGEANTNNDMNSTSMASLPQQGEARELTPPPSTATPTPSPSTTVVVIGGTAVITTTSSDGRSSTVGAVIGAVICAVAIVSAVLIRAAQREKWALNLLPKRSTTPTTTPRDAVLFVYESP